MWTILSPVGVVEYPHTVRPDTKFDKFGCWSVCLSLSKEDAQPIIGAIQHAITEATRNTTETRRASKPYTQHQDGSCAFSIRAKAWPKASPPRVFGADGQEVSREAVKHGSKARVRFALIPFSSANIGSGVALRLQEIHLI